jgi:hypothetical protein
MPPVGAESVTPSTTVEAPYRLKTFLISMAADMASLMGV